MGWAMRGLALVAALGLFGWAGAAAAGDVLLPQADPEPRTIDWVDVLSRQVPPLAAPTDSWPLILWHSGPYEPQPREVYARMRARGVVPHVRLDLAHIPMAKALTDAGAPVIVMEGQGGSWPAELGGPPSEWQHRFEAGWQPKHRVLPCLLWLDGWAAAGKRVRDTLRAFRDAGVTVAAVWMDWEGDPMDNRESYDQARHCERCRRQLAPETLADEATFRQFRGQLWMDLLGTYLAAPVKEVFPAADVTNWMLNISAPERLLRYWDDKVLPPAMPPMVTSTNAVAYGHTDFFRHWNAAWTLDREHVDQFTTHLLLRMVSDDAANRRAWAPHLRGFPWVARWCPEGNDDALRVPIMTRERYREVLRHMWLRGVDGMQVFNAVRKGFESMAVAEAEDALAVYREMHAEGDLLRGEPLDFTVPGPQSDEVLWSGRRLGDRAVVRVFKQGSGTASVRLEIWPGHAVTLEADTRGRTYHLAPGEAPRPAPRGDGGP